MKLTPNSPWVTEFLAELRPYEEKILNARVVTELAEGKLSLGRLRAGLVNFYPLIESFPKLISLSLLKVGGESGAWNEEARSWFIKNLATERLHMKWWLSWAKGFGISRSVFRQPITPPPPMDAINHYLWRVCTYGEVWESLAACNVAIEGPTGEWTKKVLPGVSKYRNRPGVTISAGTVRWVRAHASYDDKHPVEALELLKGCALTEKQQSDS